MALTKITPQMFDTSATAHDLNVDNGTFVVDGSASRVGIGTSTPSTLLDVNGTATATTFVGALTGNVTGNVTGTAATVTGAAQTNITSVGTLSSLTVSGALNGTLSTAAQTNITSLGTLTSLTVDTTVLDSYVISQNTSDGSDNSQLSLAGGGADSDGRGARARLYGNEHSSKGGDVDIATGNIANAQMDLYVTGNFTLDAGGEIILDADTQGSGNGILLKDAGLHYGSIFRSSSHLHLKAETQDKNLLFLTNNGGSELTAMTIQSDGKVGIGETSPLGTLHVKSTDSGATADASADDLVVENNSNTGISILSGASSNGSIYFGDSGTNWDGYIAYSQADRQMTLASAAGGTYLKMNSTGSMGIGVTPSASHYETLELGTVGCGITGRGAADTHFLSGLYWDGASTHKYAVSGVAVGKYQITNGIHYWSSPAAGTAGNTATVSANMTLLAGGNLGIGTTNPSELFHVQHGTSNAKILIETDSSTSISEIQFKSANNEIHRIGVETATGNQGYGGSTAYSLNMFARSGREIHFGSGTTQHMRIKDNGHVGVNIDPYAQFGVYRNHTDPYTPGSFLDYPTMELKHPSTTGSYNGTRYTNTAGNYEWFAGTEQVASNAADYVFQGYDRANTTYREMARIHDSGSITAPNQVGFRARGTRAAWAQGPSSPNWFVLTSGTNNASGGTLGVGLTTGGDSHMNGYNVGNCFNASNGRFTAPIEGKYQVYGSVYCSKFATTAGDYIHFLVYINGQQINEIYTIGGHMHTFTHDFHLNFSTIFYLEVNDYVNWQVYMRSVNTRIYGDHLSIGAHLLS